MIREIDNEQLRECMVGTDPVLVVIAPNFEERSRGFVDHVLALRARISDEGLPLRPLRWLVLIFQGDNPNFLDGVKGHNARKAITELYAEGFEPAVRFKALPYPITGPRLVSEIRDELRDLERVESAIIDFSAIPRNVLYRLIESITQGQFEPHIDAHTSIHLAYCWATSYPDVRNLELIGEIRGQSSQLPLAQFVAGADYCDLTVLAAGSVHDAYGAVTGVRDLARSAVVNLTTIYFMNPWNLDESWKQLRNHHGLLREANNGWQIEYCFGTNHFVDIIERRLERALVESEKGRKVAFAAAHFGPKPMVVATQMILDRFVARQTGTRRLRADMFNGMGTQYLSVYSLGVGRLSFFSLDGAE